MKGLTLPAVPDGCEPNWHIYALLVDPAKRDAFVKVVKEQGVDATTHFEPLHTSPYGKERLGLRAGMLPVTERVAASIVRLPLYPQMTEEEEGKVVEAVRTAAKHL